MHGGDSERTGINSPEHKLVSSHHENHFIFFPCRQRLLLEVQSPLDYSMYTFQFFFLYNKNEKRRSRSFSGFHISPSI